MRLFLALFLGKSTAEEIETNHTTSADQIQDQILDQSEPESTTLVFLTTETPSVWGEWGECSRKCGTGYRTRETIPCVGLCSQEEDCNPNSCTWSVWADGNCSKECGPGLLQRTRSCPESGQCIGSSSETITCTKKACATASAWTQWGNWSTCTKSCGPFGSKKRSRECQGSGCTGSKMETWGCNKKIKCPVKWTQNKGGNKYANWANWSHCKGNCGNGSRDRWRRCDAGWNKCQSQGPPKEIDHCQPSHCVKKPAAPKPTYKPAARTTRKPSSSGSKLGGPVVNVPGNLMGNGNCERQPGTWGAVNNFFCNSCTGTLDTSQSHSGKGSLRVTGRKASWAGMNYNFGMTISDGSDYTFRGWINVLKWGNHKVMLTANIQGSGLPKYVNQVSTTVPGFQWAKLEGNVAATGGSVTLYLEGMDKNDYLIDDFSLVKPGASIKTSEKSGAPAVISYTEVLRDPGFEISPNWGAGWGCQGCTMTPHPTDKIQGKRAVKISGREDTWAGPVQNLVYGTGGIVRNVVYTAQMWIKSLGTDHEMDTYELTVKIDKVKPNKYVKDIWLKFGKLCTVPGKWGLLSGEIQLTIDPAQVNSLQFYVEGPKKSREFLADGASLKVAQVPDDWFKKSDQKIDILRKSKLSVKANYDQDVTISIEQKKHEFPFGSAVDAGLFTSNMGYKKFFLDNFNTAVLENKLKWKQIEPFEGNKNYHEADNAIKELEKNNIPIRGHAAVWAVEKYTPKWLKYKSGPEVSDIAKSHVENVIGRYKNRLFHWDVNNEMLHGDYFQRKIGGDIRADLFKWAKKADPTAKLYVNDYEVVSGGLTNCYKEQIRDLLSKGAPIDGIGVQCHFKDAERNVNPIQVTGKFDSLAELGLPIWVTELDISQDNADLRAKHLEYFLRAAFEHKSVEGIMLWGFWDQRHWRGKEASLVDGPSFTLNAAGKKYRELVYSKWWSNLEINSEEDVRVFKGDYQITIKQNGKVLESKTLKISDDTELCFGDCADDVQLKFTQEEGSGSSEIDF